MRHRPFIAAAALLGACTGGPSTEPVDTDTGDTAAPPLDGLDTSEPGPTPRVSGTSSPACPPEADCDGDGFAALFDCDDNDRLVYPGAAEECRDGKVNDCDRRTEGAEAEICAHTRGETGAFATSWLADYPDRVDRVSMAEVGDINGDGHADLAYGLKDEGHYLDPTGEPTDEYTEDFWTTGGVLLLYGPIAPTGYTYDERWYLWGRPDTVRGDLPGHIIGAGVERAGDLDGDGFGELIFGNSAGPTDDVWLVWGPSFTSMDEAQHLYTGPAGGCISYANVSSPDLSGDGAPDLILGSPCLDQVLVYAGAGLREAAEAPPPVARVSSGRGDREGFAIELFAEADLTGDGLPDLAVSALGSLEDATGYVSVFEGPLSGDVALEDAVAQVMGPTRSAEVAATDFAVGLSAGDADGDGYADLAIGDPFYGTYTRWDAGLSSGWVGVIPGPVAGISRAMDAPSQVSSETYALGGHVDLRRDLDGDGRADLFTSCGFDRGESYWMSSGYLGIGHAYVFLAPLGGSRLNSSAELHYSNDEVADWGAKAQTTADLTGDGWPDLLIGGPGNYVQLFEVPAPIEPGAWGSAWR
jgi:hypothetical protein